MRKELQINREELITERDAEGNLKFFRLLPDGRRIEIDTQEEGLVDALHQTLWQLDNLKEALSKTEENPGPLYHLLDDMLKTVQFKFCTIGDMIYEQVGQIRVYTCDGYVKGVRKGDFLGVSRKNA